MTPHSPQGHHRRDHRQCAGILRLRHIRLFRDPDRRAFFPSNNGFLSLMASLATFGAGFVARPVGAWVIGGYADRHGRKKAMFLSMTMMGMGSSRSP
jgi:MFS family permease